jgi:UDP-glucose 4-epimerase
VRDYLHVADVASAHVAAARALDEGRPLATTYNLGRGSGVSVREIMTTVARVTGTEFVPGLGPRRPGDPARIVASSSAAEHDLRWRAEHDLDDMVASAWDAWRSAADARLA